MSELSVKLLTAAFKAGIDAVQGFIEVGEYDEFVRLQIYKQLYNLKRSGYFEIRKDKKNQSFFHLTPKGKLSILKYLHLEKLRSFKWDGHWRVIIFDLPEKLKKWREYMRNELRVLGFEPLQKSVYITPYPVTGELDQILKEWGLRKYFRYLTVNEIDGENGLKKKFNIKK